MGHRGTAGFLGKDFCQFILVQFAFIKKLWAFEGVFLISFLAIILTFFNSVFFYNFTDYETY